MHQKAFTESLSSLAFILLIQRECACCKARVAVSLRFIDRLLQQNFFRSYPKLAGMTGTASTESAEFSATYDLAVTVVPTNRVRHSFGCIRRHVASAFTRPVWCATRVLTIHEDLPLATHVPVTVGRSLAALCCDSRATWHLLDCCGAEHSPQPLKLTCPAQPTLREDASDVVFSTEEGKWKAVLAEIKHMHKSGRPVLVGTTSVERSEKLASLLDGASIQYQVPSSGIFLYFRQDRCFRELFLVALLGGAGIRCQVLATTPLT